MKLTIMYIVAFIFVVALIAGVFIFLSDVLDSEKVMIRQQYPGEQINSWVHWKNKGVVAVKVYEVPLPDGRKVFCIESQEGISCEW